MFSGSGILDRAVERATAGTVVWHCETDPAAKAVLATHWPDTPNLGDVRRINWSRVRWGMGPIDLLCGGFPCTDISDAGSRAGLRPGTQSGLWSEMVRAIETLRPPQVFIENVRALLTTPANRTPIISTCRPTSETSNGTPKPASGWCESSLTSESCTAGCTHTLSTPSTPPTASAPTPTSYAATNGCFPPAGVAAMPNIFPAVAPSSGVKGPAHAPHSFVESGVEILDTAIGAVLGDLADLGYDAQWETVSASRAGAPHRRQRVFIVAHTSFL